MLGKAIAYSLNQWEKRSTFLKDGILEIDNKRSERSTSQRKRAASVPVYHVSTCIIHWPHSDC
ncbi:IS66 family transposase [Paenibacillus popilliae]|uniref:IS66 family transposase n=1 Tax=Paenibacillus popilliae TaxID=78057 RepID=UPI003BF463EA